ncbi:MAG: exodeoxyribonuclease VII small subunit [Clostridia bacterium]
MEEKKLTFEEALKKLEEIVKVLEQGSAPLDEAIKYYEEGTSLSDYCTKVLATAEQKVTILVTDANGDTEEQDFKMKKEEA